MPGPAEAAHGPMFIGTAFAILLLGIMVTQVYIYFTSYRRDKLFLKLLVIAVFLVDIINTAFNTTYMYVCVILHFGDVAYLQTTNWQFITGPVLIGMNSLMVQFFFAWRICVLTRNWFLVGIVAILSLASGTCAFLTTWKVAAIPQFARFQESKGIVIVWLACAAAADITITTILQKHKTGFKASDIMIDRIIRVTVQTGLITSVVATIDLVIYLASSSGLHLLFNFTLCQLYSNTLTGSLNTRGRWRHDHSMLEQASARNGQSMNTDTTLNTWQVHDVTSSRLPEDKGQGIVDSTRKGVFVHVESHELRDLRLQEGGLRVEEKAVGIPARTKGESFSSISDA